MDAAVNHCDGYGPVPSHSSAHLVHGEVLSRTVSGAATPIGYSTPPATTRGGRLGAAPGPALRLGGHPQHGTNGSSPAGEVGTETPQYMLHAAAVLAAPVQAAAATLAAPCGPPCPDCAGAMLWSDHADGPYATGWTCNVKGCVAQCPPAGVWRWFCPRCQNDICGACIPQAATVVPLAQCMSNASLAQPPLSSSQSLASLAQLPAATAWSVPATTTVTTLMSMEEYEEWRKNGAAPALGTLAAPGEPAPSPTGLSRTTSPEGSAPRTAPLEPDRGLARAEMA